MLGEILSLIVSTVAGFVGGVFLLRFWMQAVRVRPPGSLGEFTFQLTDWLVKPLRRVVPGVRGYDWASFIGAVLIAILAGMIGTLITGQFSARMVLASSVGILIQWIYYGLMGLILIDVAISWINPYAPMAPFIRSLSDPILRPLRRYIPLVGNIDLSPLIALLLLNILMLVTGRLLVDIFRWF